MYFYSCNFVLFITHYSTANGSMTDFLVSTQISNDMIQLAQGSSVKLTFDNIRVSSSVNITNSYIHLRYHYVRTLIQ